MRAAWYDQQGPAAQVLRYGELPHPVPGPGENLLAEDHQQIIGARVPQAVGVGRVVVRDRDRVQTHCSRRGRQLRRCLVRAVREVGVHMQVSAIPGVSAPRHVSRRSAHLRHRQPSYLRARRWCRAS